MANFSCSMDPDEVKILQIKREDMGHSWEGFMHYIVEIVEPLRDVEDLIYLKNNVHELMKK